MTGHHIIMGNHNERQNAVSQLPNQLPGMYVVGVKATNN